jgi:hypothetical protein
MNNVAVALRLRDLPPLGWLGIDSEAATRRPRSKGVLWESRGI